VVAGISQHRAPWQIAGVLCPAWLTRQPFWTGAGRPTQIIQGSGQQVCAKQMWAGHVILNKLQFQTMLQATSGSVSGIDVQDVQDRCTRCTCITRRRVVALDQSLVSSRQRMMYSFCSIFARTMPSTCLAEFWSEWLRRPGAAEMSPAFANV
jgi:hypothetical protein